MSAVQPGRTRADLEAGIARLEAALVNLRATLLDGIKRERGDTDDRSTDTR